MRQNPSFALTDPAAIRQVIRDNPWAVLVSSPETGLVASHYPVLLDEGREELSVVTHVGRPDERIHGLGDHELLMVFQGPHGYISSSWYDADPAVPTWNFVAVHLRGVPELLPREENLRVLDRLVAHFEAGQDEPRLMRGSAEDAAYAERIEAGTVGLRLTPTSVVAKAKLSQNRAPHVVDRIIERLADSGQRPLADAMRAVHARDA